MNVEGPVVKQLYKLTWWKVGLALLSSLLIYLAFPPADLGAFAWVGLVPLFFALTQVRPAGGFVLGLVFGLGFFIPFLTFMTSYGTIPWIAAAVFQALFYGLFGLAATAGNSSLHPALRALPMAAAFTLAAEIFRGSVGGLGFTNGDLAYSQHSQLPILQIASIIGHYGVGFVIAVLNAALAQALLAVSPGVLLRPAVNPRWFAPTAAKTCLAIYVFLLLSYIWGSLVMRGEGIEQSQPISVAAVQGAVRTGKPISEDDVERSMTTYLELSKTIPEDVRLIVWPETAIPGFLNLRDDLVQRIGELAIEKDSWVLAGAPRSGDTGKIFNTLYLISPTGEVVDTYSKVLLVPFGEYVPDRERYKFLENFPVRKFDFTHGEGHKVVTIDGHKFGPLICFEMLFPHALWANTRQGAEVIIAATSDEWAADTPEIAQHSYTAAVRAIESRRYIIRAGTWGVSSIITPYGRFLSPVEDGAIGAAWDDVYPRTKLSTYHTTGDLPILLVCLAAWFAGIFGVAAPRSIGKRGD